MHEKAIRQNGTRREIPASRIWMSCVHLFQRKKEHGIAKKMREREEGQFF